VGKEENVGRRKKPGGRKTKGEEGEEDLTNKEVLVGGEHNKEERT